MTYIVAILLFLPLLDGEPWTYVRQETIEVIEAEVTAYTARKAETDSTPFITASNKRVREGIVANNCLPIGSKVKINNKIYTVEDRMNRRYGCAYFDIFHWSLVEARNFGRQSLKIVLLN